MITDLVVLVHIFTIGDSWWRRVIYWWMFSACYCLPLWNIDLLKGTFCWISKCASNAAKPAVQVSSAGVFWKKSCISGPVRWISMAFFLGYRSTTDAQVKYMNDCFLFLQVCAMFLGSPCELKDVIAGIWS